MEVRLARPDDVPTINAFTARSIEHLHPNHYSATEIESAVRLAYGVDWQLIRDGTYYVAEIDGGPAGAGGWSFRQTLAGSHGPDEPPSPPLDPARDAARIRAFYIDPGYVRRGIASRLLGVCERAAHAAGFGRAELTSTLQAVPFYHAHRYRIVRPLDLNFSEGFKLRTELMEKNLAGTP